MSRYTVAPTALQIHPARPLAQALVLMVLAVWIAFGWAQTAHKQQVDVETVVAAALIRDGRSMTAGANPAAAAALALMAFADPTVADGLACTARAGTICTGFVDRILAAQLVVAWIALWLTFATARRLSGDTVIALIATCLAVASMRHGDVAGMVRPHIWELLVQTALLASIAAGAHGRWSGQAAAGVFAVLSALADPRAVVLLPATAVGLALATASWRSLLPVGLGAAAALIGIAAGLGWSVWPAESKLLATGLAQRLAFLDLEPAAWWAGLVRPIPLLGEAVGLMLPASVQRALSASVLPDTVTGRGLIELLPAYHARAHQDWPATAVALATTLTMRDPLSYLLSMPVILMRGLFAGGGVIALVGVLHVPTMLRHARAEGGLGAVAAVGLPPLLLFAANVLTTDNVATANPTLPLIYAYAIAYVAKGW